MSAVQRAAAADQPQPGAVLAAGHHLWRQWTDHVRVAELAGPNAHPCWQRPHTPRGGRRAEPNTLDLRDADADARRCTEAPSARPAVASRADRDERHAGPVEPGDEDFLYRVYARGGASPGKLGRDAKGSLPSDAGRRPAPILPGHYSDAAFQVILVDGEPAGRLYVARWGTRSGSSTSPKPP
jgi:hypothetical protein